MAITRTTFRLHITRGQLLAAHLRAWLAQRDPLLLFVPLITILLIGLAIGSALMQIVRPAAAAPTAQPTAGMIVVLQTARAVALPTALPTARPRLITAYDAPNGTAFPDPIP